MTSITFKSFLTNCFLKSVNLEICSLTKYYSLYYTRNNPDQGKFKMPKSSDEKGIYPSPYTLRGVTTGLTSETVVTPDFLDTVKLGTIGLVYKHH